MQDRHFFLFLKHKKSSKVNIILERMTFYFFFLSLLSESFNLLISLFSCCENLLFSLSMWINIIKFDCYFPTYIFFNINVSSSSSEYV